MFARDLDGADGRCSADAAHSRTGVRALLKGRGPGETVGSGTMSTRIAVRAAGRAGVSAPTAPLLPLKKT